MPLNRRQIIQLARAIEERRTALGLEIESDQAIGKHLPDLGEAVLVQDLNELRELEAAQRRIAEGTYGVCVDCGSDIAFERLRTEPEAPRCLQCQARREKTYRK